MCLCSSSVATRSRSTHEPVTTSSAPSRILRVGQIVTRLAAHIQSGDEFKDLWIEGEVVQARSSPVGHVYFTLRDNVGQLQCVLFAMKAAQVALTPRDGNKVLAHGYIELYTKDGRCQLQVDDLRPAGAGDAYLRFEALKRRLTAEGLFAVERKRPLPPAPRRIGVVTSPIGAVWHDIQQIVARRDARMELIFAPAQVQGVGAVESLIAALDGLAQIRDLDVVILARGGGAAEDPAPVHDDALVRARGPPPAPTGRVRAAPSCRAVPARRARTRLRHRRGGRRPHPRVGRDDRSGRARPDPHARWARRRVGGDCRAKWLSPRSPSTRRSSAWRRSPTSSRIRHSISTRPCACTKRAFASTPSARSASTRRICGSRSLRTRWRNRRGSAARAENALPPTGLD